MIDRRTFLRVAGAGAAGLLLAERVLAQGQDAPAPAPAPPPPDPVEELALALDFDPERIFRFVADEIRYEPYAGVLRGAQGTLLARAGNSADQAVLLGALMDAALVSHRFVTGRIDGSTAEALLSSAMMDRATAESEFEAVLAGPVETDGPAPAPTADPALGDKVDAAVERAESVVAWARDELTATVSTLETALAGAGIAIDGRFSALPDVERDQHTWLQVAAGPDWVDLDPSTPGAVRGDAPATADGGSEAIPRELRHIVRFSVIAEVVSGGRLREETLLEVEEFADVLARQPIGLVNIEREGLKALGANVTTVLEGGTSYVPCLLIGEGVVVGSGAIRFGGDAAADPFAVADGDEEALPEGEPIAEWLQVTIQSPEGEPVVVRRAIFDRLGPAARDEGTPDPTRLEPAELVELEPAEPLDYLPAQRTFWLTVATGPEGGPELMTGLRAEGEDPSLAAFIRGYHLLREAGSVELAMPEGVRAFVDRPNIVALTLDQELVDDDGLRVRPVVDILHRSLATLPLVDVPATLPPALVAGVLPHVIERLVVGDAVRGETAAPAIASVGAVFEAAREAGVGIRVVSPGDDLAGLDYPADTLARLRAAVSGGSVAVLPERLVSVGDAPRAGWWLIDPLSGRTADQMDDGGGTSAAEEMTVIIPRVRNARALRRLRQCQIAIFFAALGVLTGVMAVGAAGGAAAAGASGRRSMALGLLGAGAIGGGDVAESAARGMGC